MKKPPTGSLVVGNDGAGRAFGAADSFAPGDIKTARMFGTNVAEALLRMATDVEAEVTR